MSLPRGFKANAERESVRLRKEMGLAPSQALDMTRLAAHLNVQVVNAGELIDIARLEELERIQAYSFSAATFDIAEKKVIVTSPLRSPGRMASDIAHELAHLVLGHQLSEVREIDGVPFRTCSPEEEEQATAFGGTLLLPRALLSSAARQGLGPEQIASKFKVTPDMARFRYHSTGIASQISAQMRRPQQAR